MKRILITGANSYIGISFENYIRRWPTEYTVNTVDMMDDSWRKKSFSGYDAVFHVAGIVHSDNGKISKEKETLYYKINADLTIETAQKAKCDGAKQFVFMSSAIVYGNSAPIGKVKMITKDTPASPANCYGDSKLQAEKGIQSLQDNNFNIVILRPPMIYGPGCKGNYQLLSKLAQMFPVFPDVNNIRSMLYIENLCEFVRLMVINEESGIFLPQNSEYSNTSQLVKMIAEAHGKKVYLMKGFTGALKLLAKVTGLVNKAFGSLVFEKESSRYKDKYALVDFGDSIHKMSEEYYGK